LAAKRKGKLSLERVPLVGPSYKAAFDVIAERRFQLRGPAKREVVVRIGTPEKDKRDFRCAFQVVGLSDNSVQYSHGIDSFQALYLAFVGARRQVENNVEVLSGFFKKVSIDNEAGPWDLTMPIFVSPFNHEQLARLMHFLEHDLWAESKARAPARSDRKK
jgi:hypothetical protein